jgi:hypothetical protein
MVARGDGVAGLSRLALSGHRRRGRAKMARMCSLLLLQLVVLETSGGGGGTVVLSPEVLPNPWPPSAAGQTLDARSV